MAPLSHPDPREVDELERQPILAAEIDSLLDANGGGGDSGGLAGPVGAGDVPWWRRPVAVAAMKNLALIVLWYFFGTFLSIWNKLLVGKEHGLFGKGAFPAPFLMSAMQFCCQHLLARGLLASGLARRKCKERLSWRQYARTIVPNGVATGLDIGFSNYSLVFITLSFYVMCKSTTPLFLLSFAILWGIEKPSWSLAAVVFVITCGLLLLVAGETRFDLLGFGLVMSAAMLAGLRWTITQVLLQGNRHQASSGGPVEVIFQLTPVMGLSLALISLCFERLWDTLPSSPYFSTPAHCAVTLAIVLVGGVIAFTMVWAEFMLIANTSALTFMVAGTFKEIVTVGAAVLFLHERFTVVNALGLVVLIAGVVLFNWLKYQKLRQGEIRPVPLDNGLAAHVHLSSSGGGGSAGGEPASRQSVGSWKAVVGNGGGGGGGGGAVELVRTYSDSHARPPSPLGGETSHRLVAQRLLAAQTLDEEGGSLPSPTSDAPRGPLRSHRSL